jgi:hypothetical protein
MRTPVVYSADQIRSWTVQCVGENGLWTLARPMSWPGINLQKRITAAWMVFTGRADCLIWHGGEQ